MKTIQWGPLSEVGPITRHPAEGYIEYGLQEGTYPEKTDMISLTSGIPVEMVIDTLQPDTRYYYRLGGKDKTSRGGLAIADKFEWGGYNVDGVDGFAEKRPGWEKPIHQLLVENNVSIVFHGHDHLFAKEELDGVIYQLVPQPGSRRYDNTGSAKEYGYVYGDVLSSPGHLRVTVSPEQLTVDYVRAYLPKDERGDRTNREVAYSYTVNTN